MPGLVTFIVVNWNGKDYINECLTSIKNQSYGNFEIIVVDNGSTDVSREILQQTAAIRLIENKTNRGFGPANNQALAESKGEIIAFVNNDVILDANWLGNLITPMLKESEVGMCAAKTLSYDQREVIDNTGHLMFWDGMNRGRGRMQKDEGQFDRYTEAFFPSGCACLFRAETLKQIGYFDEDFYLYGDDTELGIRARLAGWRCAFVPSAVAYHRGSASLSYYHPLKFFFVERNRLWVALKYFPLELLLLNPFFSSARYFYHLLAMATGKGVTGEFAEREASGNLFGLWVEAQFAALRGAGRAWRKRRQYFQKFRWSRKQFYRCFLSNRITLKELTFTP